MRAGQVLETLNISRSTLMRWRRKGYIRAKQLPNGQYEFYDDDVWKLKLKGKKRLTVTYARVSTYKQKHDLQNQIQEVNDFAKAKGYKLAHSYSDVASGISFKDRHDFFKMLDLILQGKIQRVIISHKDRLSRVDFDLLKYLFDYYNTEIIVVSDLVN